MAFESHLKVANLRAPKARLIRMSRSIAIGRRRYALEIQFQQGATRTNLPEASLPDSDLNPAAPHSCSPACAATALSSPDESAWARLRKAGCQLPTEIRHRLAHAAFAGVVSRLPPRRAGSRWSR